MDTRIVAIETYVGLQKNNFGVAVEPYLDEIEMGIQVAKKVVAKLPSNNEPISTVIFASAGIRHIFPSAAAAIVDSLGLTCPCFDIFAGCAGVGQAIELASSMEGMILIISADNLSRTIDSEEPSHFALRQFADGAVGIIVSHNAVSGHRIVATNGQTNASFHQYYRSVNGVVKRNLPPEVKPLLSAAYLDAWTSITRKLLVKSLDTEQLWIFCNQGDKKLFEPLIDALDFPDVQLVNTNHGHAGGADPWIGLMADTPPKGSQAILLSSGIGFHFHGILLEV